MLDPKGHECWVHWEFDREVWNRWALTRFQTDKKDFDGVWIVLAVVCALVGAFVNAKSNVLVGAGIGALGGLAYGLFVGVLGRFARKRKYQALLRNAAEVYIGPWGVFSGKWSTAWNRYGWHLKTVTVVEGTPMQIRFGFDQRLNSGNIRQNIFVPVPPGSEESVFDIVFRVREVSNLLEPVSAETKD